MNILILGSGIVGANLAKKLSEQGKNVFLLDDDANELKNLSERFDIKTICNCQNKFFILYSYLPIIPKLIHEIKNLLFNLKWARN